MAARGALQVGTPIPVVGTAAAQQVLPTDAHILGFMCVGPSGTIALNDANIAGNSGVSPVIAATPPAAGNLILPSMTMAPGTYYPFPAVTNRGLVATIAAGTTVVFFVA